VRDIAKIKYFQRDNGLPYNLKYLAKYHFDESIQTRSHNSMIDANVTMNLYQKYLLKKFKSPDKLEIVPFDFWHPSDEFLK